MEYKEIECNSRILLEVVEETNIPQYVMESMVAHYSRFTANTIRAGAMEGIFFPFLGKFQVKHKAQQLKALIHSTPVGLRDMIDTSKIMNNETL